jgi:hypothetical protein
LAQGQTRSITSDDFAGKRPTSAALPTVGGGRAGSMRRRRPAYNYARKGTTPKWKGRKGATSPRPAAGAKPKFVDIGVTLWKLRPPQPTDKGVLFQVKLPDGGTAAWSAERVDPDTGLRANDLVRLAVESPAEGYLYVINSEIASDGTLGDPILIFPESLDENNTVVPGMLVDIPDQREQWPYFRLSPNSGNYGGEGIAVLLSSTPLAFKLDSKGKIENLDDILADGIESDSEIFKRPASVDAVYSKAEAESACGNANRQMKRDKPDDKPCGDDLRKMTRDEPLPQTIYRIKSVAGKPAVAFIRLAASQ